MYMYASMCTTMGRGDEHVGTFNKVKTSQSIVHPHALLYGSTAFTVVLL